MRYSEFLSSKELINQPSGFLETGIVLNKNLFPFQKLLVKWSLRLGRSAWFEGTGMGKTIQQLEWANKVVQHESKPVIILAPLAVSGQTHQEGIKFGIDSKIVSSQSEVQTGINITNYEKLHKFDPSMFVGVVLDESSILKSFSGSTRNQIIHAFNRTPYKLSCTATPSPNDYTELGNQAEFLNIMSFSEMKSTFFVNDAGDTTNSWRLKGHVEDNVFWNWLASWGAVVTSPVDLGFKNDGFDLPKLTYFEHIIPASKNAKRKGLFLAEAGDLNDRRRIRKDTIQSRCEAAAKLINSTNDDWLIWCGLNDEGILLNKLINNSVEVAGRHSDEYKEEHLLGFANGNIHRLVTKPEIAGWGMNFQLCNKAAFVGLNDSWEMLFQAVRRIWRFGQTRPCEVHIFIEEREGKVLQNIKRKDEQARQMTKIMSSKMKHIVKTQVLRASRDYDSYEPGLDMEVPSWIQSKS